MARIDRRPRAQRDVIEIWLHIAGDNERAADSLIDRFDSALTVLSRNPQAGRDRSELAPDLRSLPVGNYVLFYRPTADGIEVVRVLSGFRDIDAGLLR